MNMPATTIVNATSVRIAYARGAAVGNETMIEWVGAIDIAHPRRPGDLGSGLCSCRTTGGDEVGVR